MGASSARGPGGRDEDPARHPGEPDGKTKAWEPVITRPDPMSAEEWQAWIECEPAEDADPEAYPDEEDYLSPDAELTEAELAGIAEATWLAAPVAADETYAGASDDELIGVLCAWDRLGSHMTRPGCWPPSPSCAAAGPFPPRLTSGREAGSG